MNRRHIILTCAALAIMGGGVGLILRLQATQRLGLPGLKTSALPGSQNLRVDLPVSVPGYVAKPMSVTDVELNTLPADTSFGRCSYRSAEGFEALVTAVLMGADRTSIHKPQFCLSGQGFHIDEELETTVPISQPDSYELPVMKITATKVLQHEGRTMTARGLYVYWFVSEDRLTARHGQRMWWMAGELMRRGVLQRWAYVSYFTLCAPGQEDAAYERLKALIAASVPEFQIPTAKGIVPQ